MKSKQSIRPVSYTHLDVYKRQIIDNDESKLYDSIADAKRVIRGEQPYYEINSLTGGNFSQDVYKRQVWTTRVSNPV